MNPHPPTLVLASQSPRRRQLLETLDLKFRVEIPDVEEASAEENNVEQVTQENAYLKASSCLSRLGDANEVALGADTLVVLEGVVLGKPKDRPEVLQMMERLSGRTHRVVTGICLVSPRMGTRRALDTSYVTFRKITEAQRQDYANLLEPYDKAGSYAVQGLGALFIEKIQGSYTNVMGLPIELLMKEMALLLRISVFDLFTKVKN